MPKGRETDREAFEVQKQVFAASLAETREELGEVRRAVEPHRDAADQAASRAEDAARSATVARQKAEQDERSSMRYEQKAFRMSVVAGLSVGTLAVIGFELATQLIPWTWLTGHPNTLALQIGGSFALLFGALGLLVQEWRKWCWGTAVFGLAGILLGLLTGKGPGGP